MPSRWIRNTVEEQDPWRKTLFFVPFPVLAFLNFLFGLQYERKSGPMPQIIHNKRLSTKVDGFYKKKKITSWWEREKQSIRRWPIVVRLYSDGSSLCVRACRVYRSKRSHWSTRRVRLLLPLHFATVQFSSMFVALFSIFRNKNKHSPKISHPVSPVEVLTSHIILK